MSNEQIYTIASLAAAFGVFLVCLNVWHRNYRSSLTQAERDEEDVRVGGDW